jgi:lipoate-protein ligase A
LITASSPEDPVLDLALSHALLDQVAAGARPDLVRIYRPGPTAAFGRLDVLRPGFAAASAAAGELGLTPVIRSAGGHAAPYDERSLVVEQIVAADDVTAGLETRFADASGRLARVLGSLGFDARVGELAGEYCPGAHSVNVGGRLKVAGIAQRAIRGAAMTGIVLTVGGGADLREMIVALYAALELEVDPSTAGALDEARPVTVGEVEAALRADYGAPEVVEPGVEAYAAARVLIPRHAAP